MDFNKLLINDNLNLKQAMKAIDLGAEKIVFVIDINGKLLGSLSDGDIRRWILKTGSLDAGIADACKRKPLFVYDNYDIENVKKIMLDTRIEVIPVVNDKNIVVDILLWNDIFGGKLTKSKIKLDLPVVIMAGGKGTRLDPFTKVLPKPLIPVGDKTVIEMIIGNFLEFGIKDFYISVNYKSKIIKSFFEELEPDYKIQYLQEESPLGTAGSLRFLRGKIKGNFIVTNCDVIIEANFAELLKFHEENNNDITIVGSVKHFHIPYGVCEVENGGKLVNIDEKPEFSFLVNSGMYVLKSEILDLIPENEVFHATDLINKVKAGGGKVAVFPISEKSWIDTGEWIEYKNALEQLKL